MYSKEQSSAKYDYCNELTRILTSVLAPEEAEVVAIILLNRIITRQELKSLFNSDQLESILRSLAKKGVIERGPVFYSVSAEGLLRLVREKREEIERTKKVLEMLEGVICYGRVSPSGR